MKSNFIKLILIFSLSVLFVKEVICKRDKSIKFTRNVSSQRIIGGTDAKSGEFPGLVLLKDFTNENFCGATLITLDHILTAAHCVTDELCNIYPTSLFIIAGDDLSISPFKISPTRQLRLVTHIFVHAAYNCTTNLNDIAVMRLHTAFLRTSTFYPVPRSTQSPTTDLKCSVAGWGDKIENGTGSELLQKVLISVLDFNTCQQNYEGKIPNGSFCAGIMSGQKDTCQGDSGGSLICNNVITGVVSYGEGCGRPNYPTVYVDVSQFKIFIDNALKYNGSNSNIPTPPPDTGAATKTTTAKWVVLLFPLLVIFFLP